MPSKDELRSHTPGQWPDDICSGNIRYGRAENYDGFYLADASHGIPTIGSVCAENVPTVRGAHVRTFNYPGQTEAIAAQLVHRWNCHRDMLAALRRCLNFIENTEGEHNVEFECGQLARAAVAKAEGCTLEAQETDNA